MAPEILMLAVEQALEKAISAASSEIRLVWGFNRDLMELKKSLELIRGLLQDAQRKEISDQSVRTWLHDIKDVACDAEDVLDSIEYETHPRKLKSQLTYKVRNFFSKSNPLVVRLNMAHRIKQINQTLQKIKDDGSGFGLAFGVMRAAHENDAQGNLEIPETDSFLDKSQVVVGKEKEVSKIVESLLKSSTTDQGLYVIPIVGMAGLGKTTLAKKVYNEIKEKAAFDVSIWICVSDDFKERRILKGMLESVNRNQSQLEGINSILESLRESLKNKRFFLVLDDVWNEDESIWNRLKRQLLLCNEGKVNCVLVTTRSERVADIMESNPGDRHRPKNLSDDDCWEIIKNYTFSMEPMPSDLEEIGRQISTKCDGLPLIACVLGGMMRQHKTNEGWLSIQQSHALDMVKESKDIKPILRLSFDRLPRASLKQCFAYCAIFPKDFVMEKDRLIQQWISERFFQEEKGKSLEYIGNEHFHFLIGRSLFQDVEEGKYSGITTCKMHDAIHDLAQSVSRPETWMYEDESVDDISKVRLLNTSERKEMLEEIQKAGLQKKLRVLFSEIHHFEKRIWDFERLRGLSVSWVDSNHDSSFIFRKSKYLRYLEIINTSIRTLPRCITNLCILQTLICRECESLEQLPKDIHLLFSLRYLDVSKTGIKTLPKSITTLSKLETLRFLECHDLKEFPEGVENLVRLKHIYFDDPKLTPARIGQLTSLETLPLFGVGEEAGRGIEELGGLSQLKGNLKIKGLENVRNKEDANRANIKGKPGLQKVEIVWGGGSGDEANNDGEVLEALQPPPGIQRLKIKDFRGEKFPDWISDSNVLPQLVTLRLSGLRKCFELPALSRLPNLEFVEIKKAPNVRHINWGQGGANGIIFSSLKRLYISDMKCLEGWESATSEDAIRFPRLTKLSIFECPELRHLSDLFPYLTKLKIIICGKLSCLSGVRGVKSLLSLELVNCGVTCFPPWLQQCQSLESLRVVQCHELTSVPDWLKDFTSLTHLSMRHCPNLRYFPGESPSLLTSLQDLIIGGFSEELQEFPFPTPITFLSITGWKGLKSKSLPYQIQHLTSLRTLEISYFGEMEALPEWLGSLPSLSSLFIDNCPTLKYLHSVEAMRHLKYVSILVCPELEERCKEDAAEWPKISHIPMAQIGSKTYKYGKLVDDWGS